MRCCGGGRMVPGGAAQCGRRHVEHLGHGLVELADAAETRGEGHICELHRGGHQQRARGLGPAGPGEGQRAGAEFVAEDPVQLPGRIAQACGEPLDAVAVDDAVVDQPHGPAGNIRTDVPGRCARYSLRQAALARAVAGIVCRGGGLVEGDVLRLRRPRRARRPAVDARGPHRGIELPVEAGVPRIDGAVALPEVHDSILPAATVPLLAEIGHCRTGGFPDIRPATDAFGKSGHDHQRPCAAVPLRDAREIAPLLLGAVLTTPARHGSVAVRITELEAYMGPRDSLHPDPGSHTYRGPTRRNAPMFGPAGHLYVYFTYGMHYCANIVCGPAGHASAVLLRAGEIVEGGAGPLARRPASKSAKDLASGPARLATALGLTTEDSGRDALGPSVWSCAAAGHPPPRQRGAPGRRRRARRHTRLSVAVLGHG